jgi:CobQ/CobB/MinD/ParA nucleotide binding domain
MSATIKITFDTSLQIFASAIAADLGGEALKRGLIVRDTSGRLRFLSDTVAPTAHKRDKLEKDLNDALGHYARRDGVVSFGDEAGTRTLLEDPAVLPITIESLEFRLLDRRIVGSAWLESPREETGKPSRIVFASLKGGVGRSTALAVTAADLARRGKNVLIVDLDLEAPGIGDMLLPEDRLPDFGSVDYLVENGIVGISEESLQAFVGTSPLTSASGGRVNVLPAFGKQALLYPYNTLAKISRAVLEDLSQDGSSTSVTDQINSMISRLSEKESYDAILIDTRAGLSEITAPAILGLGATVLLFGTAQTQTIHGYSALFAGLKLLAQRDTYAGKRAEWRLLFKAVYAKAGGNRRVGTRHREALYDLFAENLYDEDKLEQVNLDAINFDIDDENSPHWPLVIPFSQDFVDFDPVLEPDQLTKDFYEAAYRPFLQGIDRILAIETTASREAESPSL